MKTVKVNPVRKPTRGIKPHVRKIRYNPVASHGAFSNGVKVSNQSSERELLFTLLSQLLSFDIKTIVKTTMDEGITLSGADASAIILITQKERKSFSEIYTRGFTYNNLVKKTGYCLKDSINTTLTENCIIEYNNLRSKNPLYNLCKIEEINSFICLPLIGKEKRLGLFYLYYKYPNKYNKDRIDICLKLAIQSAICIENALLFKELQESEERYKLSINKAEDAILFVDPANTQIIDTNHKGEVLTGYSKEELIGRKVWKLYPKSEIKECKKKLQRVLNGEGVRSEMVILRKDGTRVPTEMNCGLIIYEDKRFLLGICRDITERKMAEEEIRKKNEKLENFVYIISHDLKSPIISIKGFVSLLLRRYNGMLDEDIRSYLDRIQKGIENMEHLISDILELSRAVKITTSIEECNISEIIKDTIELFRSQLEDKGIKITVQKDMPIIPCNRQRIYQVFQNLISNSIKFMGFPKRPQIKIGYKDRDRFFEFYIKDNGIGIDKRYHNEEIFQIFQRLEEIDAEGTGIGLTIVKMIVENHGGKIWVNSQKGKGSTFYFTLPK